MENYEISIWEDVSGESGHFQERKIAIIGSSSMTSETRAFDPVLVRNINGTHTLTFKMYYLCNDFSLNGMDQGFEKYNNPFIPLMANERKVKLHWKNKWYDFIIKNCQEDSSNKTITYTCKDLFLNELGKTGFNLEFDNELLNNSGTITELGERILEGTDWKISGAQDTILQEHEEPVYESAEIRSTFTGTKDGVIPATTRSFTTSNSILLFHSCVPTLDSQGNLQGGANQCQFLFTTDSGWKTELNKMLVINADCYSTPDGTWSKSGNYFIFTIRVGNVNAQIIRIPISALVSNNYRGTRLVKAQKQEIDKVLNRSVYVYREKTNPSKIYWGYPSTEFTKPTLVGNLFVNYENFASLDGWGNVNTFRVYPLMQEYTGDLEQYTSSSYLRIDNNTTVLNRGLQDTYMNFPDGFIAGETYIFRYKAKTNVSNRPGNYVGSRVFTPRVASYNITGTTPITDYFTFENITSDDENSNWIEYRGTCTTSISKHEILTGINTASKKLGLFLVNNSSNIYWLEKVEFFREVTGINSDGDPSRMNPGEMSTRSIAEIYYNYYEPYQIVSDPSEIIYAYHNTIDWNQVEPVFRDNPFEEVRSITAKNSNRFNLLQTIAETFDCWCEFIIEHNTDGSIQYTNTNPAEAKKYVRFVRDIGQNNGLSFTYGLDLKSIGRTVASEQIVTKMIVPNNSNSFGTNGFCSIARCKENYPRINYILNFDYYISHGMINGSELNNDLYSSVPTDIGYYFHLHQYNVEYDEIGEKLTNRNSELTEQLAYQSTYAAALESTREELDRCTDYLIKFCGVRNIAQAIAFIKAHPGDATLTAKNITYNQLKKQKENYQNLLNEITQSISLLEEDISTYKTQQENIKENIIALDKAFYSKYSRYIQEGSWNSEDYYDDLAYYLDAVNVCYTSSRPQVSYNINVMRISEIEEFQNRKFELGDICYIQDTEFFGYVQSIDSLTPYKEKVLISEVSEALDDPTRNTFKVQNYKTQFEDLFQRITATTQSLQYKEGEYTRAASIVTTDRTIEADVLQNSIAVNEELVISAQNESIYQDNTGITLVDSSNPNQRLKITSAGIFVTTDGTWRNAIRGDGVVSEMLSAGTINTNKIIVSDGVFTTFRWDSTGINAYEQLYDNQGQKAGINLGKSIRFDHYGIYGISNRINESFVPTNEEDIWNDETSPAKFGLTWKGFFLRTNNTNGKIEISSDKDFTISQKNGNTWYERVKIGRLAVDGNGDPSDTLYGIRISNSTGQPVLETVADGELWLKKALHISSTNNDYDISVGYLDSVQGESLHRVFDANNAFIVWEDGSIRATNGEFTGTINATGGQIGNLFINTTDGSLDKVSKVEISSNLGYNFDVSGGSATPSTITLTVEAIGLPDDEHPGIQWYRSNDFNTWTLISGTSGNSCVVSYTNFNNWQNNNVCYIKVVYTTSASTVYNDFTTLYKVQDGTNGQSIWTTSTAPTTPNYTFTISNLSGGNGTPIKIGDIILYSYYRYTVTSVSSTTVLAGSRQSLRGEAGAKGDDGRGITQTTIEYAESSSGTVAPTDPQAWSSSIPSVTPGNYLWTRITLTYDSGDPDVSYSVSREGQDGQGIEDCQIITNQEEILKYYETVIDEETGDKITRLYFSPSILNIQFKIQQVNVQPSSLTIKYTSIDNITQDITSLASWVSESEYYTINIETIFNTSFGGTYLDPTLQGYIYVDWTYSSRHITKVLSCHYMTSETAAKLFINAADITAAIQSSKLVFDATGLTIHNGGFKIKNNNEEDVLAADENGNLILNNIVANNGVFNGTINAEDGVFNGVVNATSGVFNGTVYATSGSFTGTINATDGNFNGTINANSGTIGGFKINEQQLYTYDSESGTQDNTIILSGAGKKITIGDIILDGRTSTISAGSIGNILFSIDPNQAIFNNIVAKGKITTAIFEYAKTQTVGGSMLFKPSYKISSYTGSSIILEDEYFGEVNDYIYVVDSEGSIKQGINKVTAISSSNKREITLQNSLSDDDKAYFIIDVGKDGDLLIGVNANDSPNAFLQPLGMTFATLNIANNAPRYTTNLFLGDLTSIGLTGYGLYGDNVYLNGSLTTVSSSNKYAGVNTISQVNFTKKSNDTSPIIFWAGATSNTEADIQNAPFQVTEQGTIYASQGVFTGSIISNSTIEASHIYTVHLHGGTEGASSALNIYDTSQGIIFKNSSGSTPTELFRINGSGLGYGDSTFIKISSGGVEYTGNKLTIGNTVLANNIIKTTNNANLVFGEGNAIIQLKLSQSTIDITGSNVINLNGSQVKINAADIYFKNESMHYKEIVSGSTTIGYDLYL